MRIGVLGPVSVDRDANALTRRDRVVLSVLVIRAGRTASVDSLSDALWGAEPPASSAKIVQGCMVRLRKALGADTIETLPDGYRLTLAPDDVDSLAFERLVQRGEDLLALDQPARAAHVLGEALALWRGTPLADLDGWDAGRIERTRLEELRRDAQELRLDAEIRAGSQRERVSEAQRLVDAAPLRERRWALLARAQYQAGQQADALETLRRAGALLRTELGIDPGPQLTTLQRQILQQDAGLAVPPAGPEPAATCPYLGLVPYDVADADGFFGRADDVEACLERLDATGVLVVVGPSGSGKSSLVRAGVAARLRSRDRHVVVVAPGSRPMDALTALPTSGPSPTLVVDQYEQVAALCEDAAQRGAFEQALVEHAARAQLVIALRADWIAELSAAPGIADLIERGLHLLRPMGADDLRAAIEGPAAQAGLLVEPGLVDLLIREVEHEPGALPLLSHALRMTWQHREGRTLTVAGYTAAGGVRGAVAQTAEAVYNDLPPARRRLLRELLLRLVAQRTDGLPVRARVSRRLLAEDAVHEELIELLVAQRLVTTDDDDVELAHEAVTRAWPRLRAWLDDDQVGQRILRHLSVAADAWDRMNRPASELYRGARLDQAVEWQARTAPRLTPTERNFLDASVALADRERRDAEERARRQARTNRRLRRLLAAVGVVSVAAVIAGVLAVGQARQADRAALAADARRVGALALTTDDLDRSLLLAVEGVRLDDSPDTRANLLAALGRSPQLSGVLRGDGPGAFGQVTVSPDGDTIAVYDDANRLHVYDTASRRTRGTVETDDVAGTALQLTGRATFHPHDGPVAVSLSTLGPRPVRLLDPDTLREPRDQLGGFPGDHLLPWDVAFSEDGTRLAVAFDRYPDRDANVVTDSVLAVWDLAMPSEPVAVLDDVAPFTHGVAFDPDGRSLYAGTHAAPPAFDAEPGVTVYDIETQTMQRTLRMPSFPLALSADGTRIAGAGASPDSPDADDANADIVVVDTATGNEAQRLRGHTGPVTDLAFAPDGPHLASASADRTVAVWNTDRGRRVEQYAGHADDVASVAFGPGGRTLVSAGSDGAVIIWDRTEDRRLVRTRATVRELLAGGNVNRLEQFALLSPGGRRVLYERTRLDARGRPTTFFQIADMRTGQSGPAVTTGHGVFAIASWHPDGTQFASAGFDGVVRIWDAATTTVVAEQQPDLGTPPDHADPGRGDEPLPLPGLAYLGDGDQLLVGAFGGPMRRLDADTLEPLADTFVTSAGGPTWTYASPDGRTAAVITSGPEFTGSGNVIQPEDRLLLIDAVTGQTTHQAELGFDSEWADFSPDGRLVALTGRSGQVAVVDTAAGTFVGDVVAGHNGDIVSVSYSPDGELIASGSVDGRVGLWDGRTGALLGTVRVAEPGSATYVGFDPDGDTVVIVTFDGIIRQLSTRPEQWIAHACAVAGRNLTRQEWRTAFGDRPYRSTCDTG